MVLGAPLKQPFQATGVEMAKGEPLNAEQKAQILIDKLLDMGE
jgi:hypothetical protein